jgi:hypothetical protein
MSTFIYTLQRKVQELQNTLRSLQEQNYNLRNRARMLSEGDPGGPPGGELQVSTQAQQMAPPYYGGLGSAAFLTRTTQAPGGARNWWEDPMYFGYRVRGFIQGVDLPGSDYPADAYTYIGGYLIPNHIVQLISNHPTAGQTITPQHMAEILILNVMQNPNFSLTNFQSGQELNSALLAMTQAVFNGVQLQQIGSFIVDPEWKAWLSTAVRSSNEAGIWIINQNWPY